MSLQSDKAQTIATAKTLVEHHPIYIDTETTGTGPRSEIVEISVIDTDGSVLLDTLVKPLGRIPPDASRIHGITNETVATSPLWAQTWPQIKAVISGRIAGIYNSDFDLRLIHQTNAQHGISERLPYQNHFCIMKLYAQYYGDWDDFHRNYRWQSLERAARQCGIRLPNAHRAKEDALLARAVLLKMAE